MREYHSAKEHALALTRNGIDILFSDNPDVTSILRICLSVAYLLGDTENMEWIDKELSGYINEKDIPPGRSFRHKPKGEVVPFYLTDPISRIQHAVKSNTPLLQANNDFTAIETFSPDWCYCTLLSVQDRCLRFLLNTITKIEYGGKITSLIESIQKGVDKTLVELNSQINSELQQISNNINSDNPSDRSIAVHSCRKILDLVADEVFPPSDEPYIDSKGNPRIVNKEMYMNRILAYLERNSSSLLVKNQTQYLASCFDSLRELYGKGEHSKEISKFETEQIVVNTYLIVSQVLKTRDEKSQKK